MTEQFARLSRLRARMKEAGLDGLIVSSPSNIFYLSGFRGSSGALLITGGRAVLFSDFRYRLQARRQAPDFEFIEVERRSFFTVGATAGAAGLKRLGYDPANLTCELRDELCEGAEGLELMSSAWLVEQLRAVKSSDEIALIRAAVSLSDRAIAHMIALLKPGVSEREIALEGEFHMRRAGAEETAFDFIVASGPNSAFPHAETSDRRLEPGDLVVIDIGARTAGYCSDMTRTFAVQSASAQGRELYRIVYRAQRAGAASVRAGAVCGDVDRIARGLIEEAGHSDAFGHGLGHGVGLEVHEGPRLRKGEEAELLAGHVVTVEPGIYLDGFGGIRLEDLLLVTAEGAETLTGAPMPPELPIV